ncbi:hypothetical protein STENM223S_06436 [Streptomyces tendae]
MTTTSQTPAARPWEPALSARQVLGPARVRAGQPEVVAGAHRLDRPARDARRRGRRRRRDAQRARRRDRLQPVGHLARPETGLVVRDLDTGKLREVRDRWQFYRDRAPGAYSSLTAP